MIMGYTGARPARANDADVAQRRNPRDNCRWDQPILLLLPRPQQPAVKEHSEYCLSRLERGVWRFIFSSEIAQSFMFSIHVMCHALASVLIDIGITPETMVEACEVLLAYLSSC
jgi:hypothetical protein